jgi:hypothetical protein
MQTNQSHFLIAEWRRLGAQKQQELALDIARAVLQGAVGRPEEEELARALRFRAAALRRMSEDGLAAAVRSGMVRLEARPFLDILVQVHFSSRAEVLSRTYDLLGVEHTGIEVEEEVLNTPLDEARVRSNFAAVAAAPEGARLALCLLVMRYVCSPEWQPGVTAAHAALGHSIDAAG